MIAFLLKFLLTGILFSVITASVLLVFNSQRKYTAFELILYSLGFGPVITVLLLYYLLLLFPRQSNTFYMSVVIVFFSLIGILSWRGFLLLIRNTREWFGTIRERRKTLTPLGKFKSSSYWSAVLVLLATFLILYLPTAFRIPIEQHDALVYGNLGKMYYNQKAIPYTKYMIPDRNGFYFQGSQKPSFSLLLTWEMMLNSKPLNREKDFDLFYRSTTIYYGLLIIAVMFLWLYRKSPHLALLGLLVIICSYGFVAMLMNYHLDTYRIFFLVMSWIWLGYTIKNRDKLSYFLLAVFSGFAGFTHPIGLAVALINMLALFLFDESKWYIRIVKVAGIALIILVLGNFHYLLEIFYGSLSGYSSYVPAL